MSVELAHAFLAALLFSDKPEKKRNITECANCKASIGPGRDGRLCKDCRKDKE